ncbi:uncharacterized protein LOC113225601 [Hyposmocoma kahamanoa]|uniref:uncharacterized protein LOC113225601 n=1 Tax=Hyposmocoma kahamanoa TaxID=1477025 RepID=UPI000E6D9C77|nr:uncharacterized protein LOC113225601 [Hyposmocoma kahamanoa]
MAEIKLWLSENYITYHPTLRKPSLLVLERKYKPDPVYFIDELLADYDHTVVRLPPYHCDLNPIELIWSLAKRKVALQNVGAKDIKQLTEEAFSSITTTDWKQCCEHVKKIEREYYERGTTLYEDIDQLVLRVGEDSSSESESESEAEDIDMQVGAATSQDSYEPSIEGIEYLDFDLLE